LFPTLLSPINAKIETENYNFDRCFELVKLLVSKPKDRIHRLRLFEKKMLRIFGPKMKVSNKRLEKTA
jgi:hypothetical protein